MSRTPETRPERVLFVHAHPDDETLVSGGTIATLIEAGAEVTVLTATRGERGEMLTPELAPLAGHPDRIAAHREAEIAAAFAALGGPSHLWLGGPGARPTDLPHRRYTDSGMEWGADGRPVPVSDPAPDSFASADVGEVVDDIAAAIRSTAPDTVISYADDGWYGHPDHLRVHHATRRAAKAEDVPFVAIVDAASGEADIVVDVLPVRAKVRAALEQYRSQLTVDPVDVRDIGQLSYVLPHGARNVVPEHEGFRYDEPPARPAPRTYREMGAGGRIAAVLGAVVVGLIIGGLGTITHQITAPGTFPIGIIIDMIIVACALVGTRLLLRSRAVVTLVALVCFALTLILTYGLGSDTVLVPANAAGEIWLVGQVFVAVVVLAWPDLSGVRRRTANGGTAGGAAGANPSGSGSGGGGRSGAAR